MSIHKIPLTPTPQIFNITLADKEYRITVRWNAAPDGGWYLDIASPDNGESIIAGIPIVTGSDLLEQYEYLNFGGALCCYGGNINLAPTFENLGVDNQLYFLVSDNGG